MTGQCICCTACASCCFKAELCSEHNLSGMFHTSRSYRHAKQGEAQPLMHCLSYPTKTSAPRVGLLLRVESSASVAEHYLDQQIYVAFSSGDPPSQGGCNCGCCIQGSCQWGDCTAAVAERCQSPGAGRRGVCVRVCVCVCALFMSSKPTLHAQQAMRRNCCCRGICSFVISDLSPA